MPRLSKWSVEALLLSDDLAKLIEQHRQEEVTGTGPRNVDGHSADVRHAQENDMPLLATGKVTTSKMPVGSYLATCTAIIEDAIEKSEFNPEIYRFYFDVDGKKDEDGNQATTDAISSRTLSPKSKLWSWLESFGLRPEVGKVIDLEAVVGRKVMVVVKQHGDYTRVEELVPVPEGFQAPPAPPSDAPTAAQEGAGGARATNPGPTIINFMGEIDWPKFWAEADAICGNRDKAKAAVSELLGGDLLPLETMEVTLVVDLLESLKEAPF